VVHVAQAWLAARARRSRHPGVDARMQLLDTLLSSVVCVCEAYGAHTAAYYG